MPRTPKKTAADPVAGDNPVAEPIVVHGAFGAMTSEHGPELTELPPGNVVHVESSVPDTANDSEQDADRSKDGD